MKQTQFQNCVQDLSWLRENCRAQFEITEFFENSEAGERLRDVISRVDRVDFEAIHFPVSRDA